MRDSANNLREIAELLGQVDTENRNALRWRQRTQQPKKGPWWLFHQEPIAGFTGWVAIFTFFLMTAAGFQAWAFVQSERAFVFPTNVEFTGPLTPTQPLSFNLEIRNSGKSPAFIEELIAVVTHGPLPEVPFYGPMEGRIRIGFSPVTPNGKIIEPLDFGPAWGVETATKVRDGHMAFYLYGRIEYRDDYSLFGPKHSAFCFRYNPERNGRKASFRNCQERKYTSAG